MTDQHPIVPSPELVKQWRDEWFEGDRVETSAYTYIANQSAFWSADQELEACCEWFQEFYKTESWVRHDLKHLRTARRPKPPSLKEQALEALQFVDEKLDLPLHNHCNAIHTIRTALEALPND